MKRLRNTARSMVYALLVVLMIPLGVLYLLGSTLTWPAQALNRLYPPDWLLFE